MVIDLMRTVEGLLDDTLVISTSVYAAQPNSFEVFVVLRPIEGLHKT